MGMVICWPVACTCSFKAFTACISRKWECSGDPGAVGRGTRPNSGKRLVGKGKPTGFEGKVGGRKCGALGDAGSLISILGEDGHVASPACDVDFLATTTAWIGACTQQFFLGVAMVQDQPCASLSSETPPTSLEMVEETSWCLGKPMELGHRTRWPWRMVESRGRTNTMVWVLLSGEAERNGIGLGSGDTDGDDVDSDEAEETEEGEEGAVVVAQTWYNGLAELVPNWCLLVPTRPHADRAVNTCHSDRRSWMLDRRWTHRQTCVHLAAKCKRPEESDEGDGGAGEKALLRVDTGPIPRGLYLRVQPAQTRLSSGMGLYPDPGGVWVWRVRVQCRLLIPGPRPVIILKWTEPPLKQQQSWLVIAHK
ncbi:hypothetical protein B0H10DRAFT_1969604 [Mycena sp. CBHHK59/15]|nr:hypothetical protein B0H10DRAFT_1969604 [Mycena sp. CBHHK59/15]